MSFPHSCIDDITVATSSLTPKEEEENNPLQAMVNICQRQLVFPCAFLLMCSYNDADYREI